VVSGRAQSIVVGMAFDENGCAAKFACHFECCEIGYVVADVNQALQPILCMNVPNGDPFVPAVGWKNVLNKPAGGASHPQ
jgi:hypothetical protein